MTLNIFQVALSALAAVASADVVNPALTLPYAYGVHAFGGKSAPCVNGLNEPVPCAGAPLAYAGLPYAAQYGKREAEADPQVILGGLGYGLGYHAGVVAAPAVAPAATAPTTPAGAAAAITAAAGAAAATAGIGGPHTLMSTSISSVHPLFCPLFLRYAGLFFRILMSLKCLFLFFPSSLSRVTLLLLTDLI